MMVFRNVISKEEMNEMPREIFSGKIIVVETEEKLEKVLPDISRLSEVGIDTESRPSFTKKTQYKTALLQIATNDTGYLIRLNRFQAVPPCLLDFLQDKHIIKIGLSLRDDFYRLNSLSKITPANCIDLQTYVTQFGIEEMSLQKIYAILFGKKISKRAQLSNWEAPFLSAAQQQYAALDAWACLRIYEHLNSLL